MRRPTNLTGVLAHFLTRTMMFLAISKIALWTRLGRPALQD